MTVASVLYTWCAFSSIGAMHAMHAQYAAMQDLPDMVQPFMFMPMRTALRTPIQCTLPPNSGGRHPYFKQYYKRYYFNGTSGLCEPFAYNNNGGNENNFNTEEDCMGFCHCISSACFIPKSKGECTGHYTKYYYNRLTGVCESFNYGGCGGNTNRFKTIEECNQVCSCGACILTGGNCRGYHYVKEIKVCRRTREASCATQPGMFTNKNACDTMCKKSACKLPMEPGTVCAHRYPGTNMYYYDHAARMCKRFFYEGCDGNENRFYSDDQCLATCGPGAVGAAAALAYQDIDLPLGMHLYT